MAIQILPEKRGLGELFGTGLGKGIGGSLEALAQQKIEGMQKKNMLSSLLGANVPENVATAIVNAPKSLQREMFKPLLRINKDLGKNKKDIASIRNLREQIFKRIKNDPTQQNAMRDELLRSGMMPEEVEVLFGQELNDNIVRYFLDKTNNDPKKARKLAEKFGYKV